MNAFKTNEISSIVWPTPSQINSIALGAFALNNFGANIPKFPDGLTTETNGGITPEQIFTSKYLRKNKMNTKKLLPLEFYKILINIFLAIKLT
jgi:hypothetical protein